MLNSKVQAALNQQINAELASEYLYLSMAAYFESEDLKGMAHWMVVQAGEEHQHAMRIFDYVNDRSGRVNLSEIASPKGEWTAPLEAFKDAYAHEVKISTMINELMNLVAMERDGASHDFLEWFAREQVEEEAAAQLIVSQLNRVGDSGVGLHMIDQQLGQRGAK
ncbi:MAG: ferritin [Thermoguttaceae bacterium]